MKISDTPLFKKQFHLFYQPFHFMRKILTTSSLEYFENSTAPSMGGGVPAILYLIQVKKVVSMIEKLL